MIKIAINGFGRIGRIAFRVARAYAPKAKVVAINTSGSMDIEGWAHLLQYDSVYSKFEKEVKTEKSNQNSELGRFIIDNEEIPVLGIREPRQIPWKRYKVDVVLEATGVFRDKNQAKAHLEAGAKKVIITANAKNAATFVLGVNQKDYKGSLIISNGSCTTNCIAPLMKVLKDEFGVSKALMSTIHSFTSNQNLVDNSHHDLRRARAAASNIIPTSTGAAKATVEVISGLSGLFDGIAYRVPTVCGSLAEVVCLTLKRTSAEEVNNAFKKAAQGELKGIIATTQEPLVSADILASSYSAIVDLGLTRVIDTDLVKVAAWYDNEWAYCCRLIEQAIFIGGR